MNSISLKYFFLFLILITITQASYSQKLVTIDYTSYYDFNFPKKIPSQLICNENESVFVEYISKAEDWNTNKSEETILGVSINDFENTFNSTIVTESFFYTKNALLKTIIFNDIFKGKNVWIKDTFEKIEWQITKESKNIANFKCYKAIGKFRGNTWSVWFSYNLPMPYGPWKLQGLPGVILQASTLNNQIQFLANKVTYINDFKSIKPDIVSDTIEFKEFIDFKYDTTPYSDFNRGEVPQNIILKDPMEPTYEWEQEPKK